MSSKKFELKGDTLKASTSQSTTTIDCHHSLDMERRQHGPHVWNSFPDLTNALLQMATAPDKIQDECLRVVERFVILLYDKTSTNTDVNKARKKLFAKTTSVQRIPPTYAALQQHVKRAVYQGGHVWGNVFCPDPKIPSPNHWGWKKTDCGIYQPFWTTLEEASKTCYELISCGCKKGCRTNCKCKKSGLKCTALCKCEGECPIN